MAKRKEIEIPDGFRSAAECRETGKCGGCSFDGAAYGFERQYKENKALTLLAEAGIAGFDYDGFVEPDAIWGYRNKMEFSFGDDGLAMSAGGSLQLGMRLKGSRYAVSDASCCLLCDGDFRLIVKTIRDFFAERGDAFYSTTRHTGTLRHVVIRKSSLDGGITVNISTTSDAAPFGELTDRIVALPVSGRIAGVMHTVCDRYADAVKPDSTATLFGRDSITERVMGLTFEITPFSFFQTNTKGAERLYGTVAEYAETVKNDNGVIYDLYCGTGTIAQILARSNPRDRVIGVEIVGEAAAAAARNAAENGLVNCSFIAGDVGEVAASLSYKPKLIVADPPRDGLHPKALSRIAGFGAENLIYVSCNPTTLARDLPPLRERGYDVRRVKIHDMFPRTPHMETVCLLQKM